MSGMTAKKTTQVWLLRWGVDREWACCLQKFLILRPGFSTKKKVLQKKKCKGGFLLYGS